MSVTICIPTKDRSEFLARLLRYYASTGYSHQIFVGDSSDEFHANRNQEAILSLKEVLQITYFACPGMGVGECITYLGETVSTPYCASLADDDIFCTGAIQQCLTFLEENSNYVAAHGVGISLATDRPGSYGNIYDVRRYPLAVLESNTGSQRLLDYFSSGPLTLLLSICRTSDWQAAFQGSNTLRGPGKGNIFRDELLPSSICAIRGKVKELDCLLTLRDLSAGSYRGSFVYDWITNPGWFPSYQFFRQRLIEELVRQDGISEEEAGEVIKRVLWPYLARALATYWQKYNAQPGSTRERSLLSPRKLAGRIPGLRRLWHSSRQLGRSSSNDISLLALLRPSSPYHEDFMPIYRAITTPPAEDYHEPATGITGQRDSG